MEEIVELSEDPSGVRETVPLFIKKLWNMVNDEDAEDIIGWNTAGDSFIIHDRFKFSTKVLPQYFKHNNMASFVRQLNFYNFHKVPNVKNQIQFAHSCFIKDVPQVLVFIRRKHPVSPKQTGTTKANDEQMMNLLKDVKAMKSKHSQIDKEMSLLKQDNCALWNELNSLRMKYAKQSSIINKLIHFLITYIHTHQTSFSKQNSKVPRDVNPSMLKSGPTLLELDYTEPEKRPKEIITEPYSIFQPGPSKTITYSTLPKKNTQSLKQILALQEPRPQTGRKPQKKSGEGITYSVKLPEKHLRKIVTPEVQNKLFEILEENEKLSVDNSLEELFTEIPTDNIQFVNRGEKQIQTNQPIIQSPQSENGSTVNSDSTKMTSFIIPDTNYIVEYPENLDAVSSPETRGVICENVSQEKNSSSNLSKESKTHSSSNILEPQPFLNLTDSIESRKKKSSSLMYGDSQCPKKKIKKKSTARSPTHSLEIPENRSDKIVQPGIQNPLLDILNKNQTDIPLEEIFSEIQSEGKNLVCEPEMTELIASNENQMSETLPIIESPSDKTGINDSLVISQLNPNENPEFLELDLEPIVQSPPEESSLTKDSTQFSILENPKQSLGLYLDTTQEELNVLQEILNSKDFSDILGSITLDRNPEAIRSSAANENRVDDLNSESSSAKIAAIEPSNDCNSTPTPSLSVDDFFNPQFMVSDD